MLRWIATIAIALLLVLDVMLPGTSIGRRGVESEIRADVAGIAGAIGESLPELSLFDLEGNPFSLADLRGHRVLLTFERSCDW